jgi:hypothetical protein
MHTESWKEIPKERDNLEDLVIGGRVILEWIWEVGREGMDWIDLDQDRDQYPSFVNVVLNVRVPWILISWLTEQLLGSEVHRVGLTRGL